MGPVFPATLFDFNGVLVDDEWVHLAAFRDVLTPMGVRVSDEDYGARYLGYDDVGAFRAMLTDAGRSVTDDEVAALVAAKRPHYRRRAEDGLVVFQGASALVRTLAARGPVGIVSGALRDEIAFALGKMGVTNLVGFVVAAEDTARCKPDPQGYEIALGLLAASGLDAKEARRTLVIEDSLAGVQAAKAAGLICLAVAHSYRDEELMRAGADMVAPRIADVDDALLGRLAERARVA